MAQPSSLLKLPYDIRYLIFQHLFPPGKQIYLQASNKQLKSITPAETRIPVNLLSSCRQLQSECSEFLYNSYLFNVVGRKVDCVDTYESFLAVLEKYARGDVHVDPFSNGEHSATMCISLHTGDGNLGTLRDRQRGVRVRMQDIRLELDRPDGEYGTPRQGAIWRLSFWSVERAMSPRTLVLIVALAVVVLAWCIRSVKDHGSPTASK